MALYYAPFFVDRPGQFDQIFPTAKSRKENIALAVNLSPERPFCCVACADVPSKDVAGGFGSPSYCFPLYTYSEDGTHRRDNIPLSALLHHPDYRARYAENLKRELPRLPLVGVGRGGSPRRAVTSERTAGPAVPTNDAEVFHAFAKAGKKLAELHVNYEQQKEYPLQRVENKEVKLDWRVEAMKLSKDRSSLYYNDFLTLTGIPQETFDYRLGNRSALEWVIDQYRVAKNEHGHITSDPNRADDEEYIVRLIGQVITVSLETVRIIKSLPALK